MTTPSPAVAPPDAPSPVKLNGPVLRFAMRVLGWSQAALARRIGIHESTMSRALAGDPTSPQVAAAILALFENRLRLEEVVMVPGFATPLPEGAVDEGPDV